MDAFGKSGFGSADSLRPLPRRASEAHPRRPMGTKRLLRQVVLDWTYQLTTGVDSEVLDFRTDGYGGTRWMCDSSGSGRSKSTDERTSTTSSLTEVPCANGARSLRSHTATSSDTPLSADEELPWGGRRLIIGTGAYDSLPIMPEVVAEAAREALTLSLSRQNRPAG